MHVIFYKQHTNAVNWRRIPYIHPIGAVLSVGMIPKNPSRIDAGFGQGMRLRTWATAHQRYLIPCNKKPSMTLNSPY